MIPTVARPAWVVVNIFPNDITPCSTEDSNPDYFDSNPDALTTYIWKIKSYCLFFSTNLFLFRSSCCSLFLISVIYRHNYTIEGIITKSLLSATDLKIEIFTPDLGREVSASIYSTLRSITLITMPAPQLMWWLRRDSKKAPNSNCIGFTFNLKNIDLLVIQTPNVNKLYY